MARTVRQLEKEQLITAVWTGFPVALGMHDITSLIGVSIPTLRKAIKRKHFPAPLEISNAGMRIWSTADVVGWMRANNIPLPAREREGNQ